MALIKTWKEVKKVTSQEVSLIVNNFKIKKQ